MDLAERVSRSQGYTRETEFWEGKVQYVNKE